MAHEPAPAGEGASGVALAAFDTFDQLSDFVTVIDPVGTIIYINPFAEQMLGHELGSARGQNIADFLHPEDLIRALRVVGMVVDHSMDVPVTPAIYRIARADGEWCPIEINASLIPPDPETGEDAGLMVILGRYSGDRDLQDRIMERLIAGESPTDVIEVIPEFGLWRHPNDHYAVFFLGDDGAPRAAGSLLARELDHLTERGAPWHRAAASGEEVTATLDDLPAGLRAAAAAAGLTDCWAMPVPDPLFNRSAVIVAWGRAGGSIMEVHRYALQTMARLLALILQWRQQVTTLKTAARRDPLTGLPNRTGFWEVLEAMSQVRGEPRVGVLYVDLDGFKGVNDAHGHRAGDSVLEEVARRISSVLRPGDVVARLGGDEFAVLCPHLHDDQAAEAIAGRIVEVLQRPFTLEDVEVTIGASVGIATAVPGDLGADDLVDAADRALYQAKDEGRGRWHLAPAVTRRP